ncbi:hypothetical protein BOTBODRAFT_64504, partial [Botryobasidium botryosum FD-172 SS1]
NSDVKAVAWSLISRAVLSARNPIAILLQLYATVHTLCWLALSCGEGRSIFLKRLFTGSNGEEGKSGHPTRNHAKVENTRPRPT